MRGGSPGLYRGLWRPLWGGSCGQPLLNGQRSLRLRGHRLVAGPRRGRRHRPHPLRLRSGRPRTLPGRRLHRRCGRWSGPLRRLPLLRLLRRLWCGRIARGNLLPLLRPLPLLRRRSGPRLCRPLRPRPLRSARGRRRHGLPLLRRGRRPLGCGRLLRGSRPGLRRLDEWNGGYGFIGGRGRDRLGLRRRGRGPLAGSRVGRRLLRDRRFGQRRCG
jgi:hypothetical protein